jgi:hypothetical protein
MKPFNETKLGQFLSTKAPNILNTVGNVLPSNGVLGIVKNLIGAHPDLTPAEKEEGMKLAQEFEIEMFAAEAADRDSARTLQTTALTQTDIFSKRYIYFLSTFIIVSATAFGFMLFWADFPEPNRRLVEMFADIYLFAGAIMVLQFFFGSSKSSHDKTDILNKQTPSS